MLKKIVKNIARPSIKSMNDIRYKDPQKINKFLKPILPQNTKKVYSTLKV